MNKNDSLEDRMLLRKMEIHNDISRLNIALRDTGMLGSKRQNMVRMVKRLQVTYAMLSGLVKDAERLGDIDG